VEERNSEFIELTCLRLARTQHGCDDLLAVRIGPREPIEGGPNLQVLEFTPRLPRVSAERALKPIDVPGATRSHNDAPVDLPHDESEVCLPGQIHALRILRDMDLVAFQLRGSEQPRVSHLQKNRGLSFRLGGFCPAQTFLGEAPAFAR
jgi:hypothetical protein